MAASMLGKLGRAVGSRAAASARTATAGIDFAEEVSGPVSARFKRMGKTASRYGSKVSDRVKDKGRGGLKAAGFLSVATMGFSSGFDEEKLANAAIDFAHGSSTFDQTAIGRNLSFNEITHLPQPIESQKARGMYLAGAAGLGITGFASRAAGKSIAKSSNRLLRFGRRGLIASGTMMMVGGAASAGAAVFADTGRFGEINRAVTSGNLNPTTIQNARAKTHSRSKPMVDGSAVLGMYNARLG